VMADCAFVAETGKEDISSPGYGQKRDGAGQPQPAYMKLPLSAQHSVISQHITYHNTQ